MQSNTIIDTTGSSEFFSFFEVRFMDDDGPIIHFWEFEIRQNESIQVPDLSNVSGRALQLHLAKELRQKGIPPDRYDLSRIHLVLQQPHALQNRYNGKCITKSAPLAFFASIARDAKEPFVLLTVPKRGTTWRTKRSKYRQRKIGK